MLQLSEIVHSGILKNRDLRNSIITFIQKKKHTPRHDFKIYKDAFSCLDGKIMYMEMEDTGILSTKKDFENLQDIDWTYVSRQIY